ncbi:MAG: tetratricopeptide repeat protein, partial [Calditrichaeota bacterium]|nr:tetratricopeptide repeat protein [Calditrichota bacterium]
MSDYLARARVLFEQSRYGMAADELRKALGEDPHNAYAHALLAVSLAEIKKPADALAAARQAVQLAPDSNFSFYVLGIVLFAQDQYREAESAARQAI